MRWLRNENPCTQERALLSMNTSCWSDSGSGQASWAGFELSSAYAAPERQAQLFQSIQIHDGTDPVKKTMGSPNGLPLESGWTGSEYYDRADPGPSRAQPLRRCRTLYPHHVTQGCTQTGWASAEPKLGLAVIRSPGAAAAQYVCSIYPSRLPVLWAILGLALVRLVTGRGSTHHGPSNSVP